MEIQITSTEEQVVLQYTVTENAFIYQDTLVYPKVEYDAMTQEQIEEVMAKKFEEWKTYINS